jgi:hypothetical protein
MTLKTDITADLEDVFFNTDEFAESITYGTATIDAVVSYDVNLHEGGLATWAEGLIVVKKSDVPTFVQRTAVTIGSDAWKTKRELMTDAYTRTIEIEKDMRPRLR